MRFGKEREANLYGSPTATPEPNSLVRPASPRRVESFEAAQPSKPSPSRIESRRISPSELPRPQVVAFADQKSPRIVIRNPSASRRRAPLKPTVEAAALAGSPCAPFTRKPDPPEPPPRDPSDLHPHAHSTCAQAEPRQRHSRAASLRVTPVCTVSEPIPGFKPSRKGKHYNLDLGISLLGKHVFWPLGLVEQISSPTGRQSSMDIDRIRVARRGPRIPIVLVSPPGSLQTSRGRGRSKGKLASDQK
ncbi:hypothetical protein E5676_scaffold852G00480 [Cucumis melo var. makuwa]|uniref:Uncharacterized protein n=1 Tax=Cucumis melo var. makuwa TaxID=1194695 RepID=A0A5D3C803_CUCMM|nr:hypothetical protein E5676_scaffold852G00480 [Cucumis melo var. makuwa]